MPPIPSGFFAGRSLKPAQASIVYSIEAFYLSANSLNLFCFFFDHPPIYQPSNKPYDYCSERIELDFANLARKGDIEFADLPADEGERI